MHSLNLICDLIVGKKLNQANILYRKLRLKIYGVFLSQNCLEQVHLVLEIMTYMPESRLSSNNLYCFVLHIKKKTVTSVMHGLLNGCNGRNKLVGRPPHLPIVSLSDYHCL